MNKIKYRPSNGHLNDQNSLPSNKHETNHTDDSLFLASNSIIEFLKNEKQCNALNGVQDNDDSEVDIESIFEEINRLSDESDERSVDEILREAEILLSQQEQIELDLSNEINCDDSSSVAQWKIDERLNTISEESTQRDLTTTTTKSQNQHDLDQTKIDENENEANDNNVNGEDETPWDDVRIFS